MMGLYLILKDYSQESFPPILKNRREVYQAESDYQDSIPGSTLAEITQGEMRKPFWVGDPGIQFLFGFVGVADFLHRAGIRPPNKILELGCGYGWMSEFLAIMGFDVLGTSIAPKQIEAASTRIRSIQAKGINPLLEFRTASMETVSENAKDKIPFDAVFVFEALHHSYSWIETLESSFACLRPGGWLLIANEPNLIHTFLSYRVAKLANTHEIGMSRSEIIKTLKRIGYSNIFMVKNRFSFCIRPIWIGAKHP